MSVFLSSSILLLHRIAARGDKASTHRALAGIHVDPERRVATASDGSRLVEVTLPNVKNFPAESTRLANGDVRPFILPAEAAQDLLKRLPKTRTPSDPAGYVALVASKPGERPCFAVTDGKTASLVSFVPIDGSFPDYRAGGCFPVGKPMASVSIDPSLLRDTLAASALGDGVTVHVFADRVVLQSIGKDGTALRAVQMTLTGKPAAYVPQGTADVASQAATKRKAVPEPRVAQKQPASRTPVVSQTADDECGDEDDGSARADIRRDPCSSTRQVPSPAQARTRPSSPRAEDRPSHPAAAPRGTPTCGQHAYHTFLIRRHGESITREDLHEPAACEKLEALKSESPVDTSFATWRQWWKLFHLLADRRASDQETCAILNRLKGVPQTASVIDAELAAAASIKSRSVA
jgi:hypothetical protein